MPMNPILNISSRNFTNLKEEVLMLCLKFAPTPRKVPDPLEFFEDYHEQCQREYNKLIVLPLTHQLPGIVEEHLSQTRHRLEELHNLPDKEQRLSFYHNLSQEHRAALTSLRKDRSLTTPWR